MSDQIDKEWAANLRARYGIATPMAPHLDDTSDVVSYGCDVCNDDPDVCGHVPVRLCKGAAG